LEGKTRHCFFLCSSFSLSLSGSHRWPPYRKPTDEEAFQAVMPAGSCVIYTGKTFHSSAANTTEDPRWGLNVDYLPAFVTEEEIAILSHPPHAAKRTPEHINRLCGMLFNILTSCRHAIEC
jgi:ectoine hydroxylase-related dioxygenase (phytanoyl-CoA dioxygenase family)